MSSTVTIPGICAKHAVITPACRKVKRPKLHELPEVAAFEEAVARLRVEYLQIGLLRRDAFTAHVVLTIEPEAKS